MEQNKIITESELRERIRKVTIYGEIRYVLDVVFDGVHYRFYSEVDREATEEESISRVITKANKRIAYEKELYFDRFPSRGSLQEYLEYYLQGLYHLGSDTLRTDGIFTYDNSTGLKQFRSPYYRFSPASSMDHCKRLIRHTVCLSQINREINTIKAKDINRFFMVLSPYYSKELLKELCLMIKQIFEQAKYKGVVSEINLHDIQTPEPQKHKKPYFFSKNEYLELLDVCEHSLLPGVSVEAYLWMVIMAFHLRCEPIELTELKISDINIEMKQVTLPSGRLVDLTDSQLKWFTKAISERNMVARTESELFFGEKLINDRFNGNFNKNVKRMTDKLFYFTGFPFSDFNEIEWSYCMIQRFENNMSEEELFGQKYLYKPAYEKCEKEYMEFKEKQKEW